MFVELFKAFSMIFIAEMGDKTQILAMTFSTRYPVKKVLIGVFLGSLLNHSLAVLLGSNLSRVVPLNTISIIAGFSFILFALWNLKFEDDDGEVKSSNRGAIYTVALAFFIGELGDKTQLTAIALSGDSSFPFFILMGTVLAMVMASVLGIIIGKKIGDKVDEFYIKISATFVFVIFGYIKLFTSLPVEFLSLTYIVAFTLLIITMGYMILKPTLVLRRYNYQTAFQSAAKKLNDFAKGINKDINDICLGPEVCGDCEKETCPIGQSKIILSDIMNDIKYREIIKESNTLKEFDYKRVRLVYIKLINFMSDHWNEKLYKSAHEIRLNMEMIIFKKYFEITKYQEFLEKLKEEDKSIYNEVLKAV